MNALLRKHYGQPDQVLHVGRIPIPVPKKDQVLVKVHAASVNAADGHLIRGTPYFIRLMFGFRPKSPVVGLDCAGTVEATGSHVKHLRVGDRVFGSNFGSFAEYSAMPEASLAVLPAAVDFRFGAAVTTAAHTALVAVEQQADVQPGHHVLVNGAAGGVGSFAVQLARARGAVVTAVCSSKSAPDVKSRLKPERTVEYTAGEDFTATSERYDAVIDTVGNQPLRRIRGILKPAGVFLSVGKADVDNWFGFPIWALQLLMAHLNGKQRFRLVSAEPTPEDMQRLAELLRDGTLSPFLDREQFSMATAVDALTRPHVCGKRVIQIL